MSEPQLITVPGKSALAELEKLRAKFKTTGLYPVLFGDAEDYERICENMEDAEAPAAVLKRSRAIDPTKWFGKQTQPEESEDEEWDEEPGEMGIITHLDILTRKPKPKVLIGLLEVAEPWEVFAHLGWGAWNDCPSPAEHCAFHRYWAKKYGAEVVSVTGDIVQCAVARPPTDREGAMHLAREQYAYCYDIVEQGVETITALGSGLLNARHWYFWWD